MIRAVIPAAIIIAGSAIGVTGGTVAPAQAVAVNCVLNTYIINLADNGYLDDYGGGSGTYVHTYTSTGSNNQTWCLEAAPGGGYYFHPWNNEGLCLDAHTFTAGQRIWVWNCNHTSPQVWCWNGAGYIVTAANAHLALHDWGLYRTVTIESGSNNTWFSTGPLTDNC
jgi:hypothetical protein